MRSNALRLGWCLVLAAALALFATAGPALAQTDPYSGGGVSHESGRGTTGGGSAGLDIPATVGALDTIPVRGCGFAPGTTVRLEVVATPQSSTTPQNCAACPTAASGPTVSDTKMDLVADANGCVVGNLQAPRGAGRYGVCAVAPGFTVCSPIQVLGNVETARSFARTGLDVLPLILIALLAIAIGHYMVSRSRPSPKRSARREYHVGPLV